MKILSIETSCDDTGISILECKESNLRHGVDVTFKVLADSLSSQTKIHTQYGGVFPMLAKREHIKNLPILLKKVMKKVGFKAPQGKTFLNSQGLFFSRFVDMIAVTSGPGLEPALWTGIVFAKELGEKWKVPVIPVNHMEGHILSVFAKTKGKFSIPKIEFPAISLLVSGGHTELVLTQNLIKHKIIGQTLDDAAGEAFDKVARMLDLPYPGGPQISKLAEKLREQGNNKINLREIENQTLQGRNFSAKKFAQSSSRRPAESLKSLFSISLPRPMLYSKNFDFSFSGLKTAVLYLIQKIGPPNGEASPLDEKTKMAITKEFEDSVVEVLTKKTLDAVEKYGAKTLIVAGGVSANKELRKIIKKEAKKNKLKLKILFPSKKLSTDNAVMIGVAGYFKSKRMDINKKQKIKADGRLSF